MHEVSWRRVKWPRPSWDRKDLLSVCGIVLGSIPVSRQYLLYLLLSSPVISLVLAACSGGLLDTSSAPLGDLLGPLGVLRGSLGIDFGSLDDLGRSWRLLGLSWAVPGPLLASLGQVLVGSPGPLLASVWELLDRS